MGDMIAINPPFRRTNGEVILRRSGRVGLNESSPLVQLHVTGTSGELARIEGDTGTSSKYLTMREGATERLLLGFEADAGGSILTGGVGDSVVLKSSACIHLATSGDAANGITVDSSGRLGVKTTTPGAELDVNGSIVADDITTGDLHMKSKDGLSDITLIEQPDGLQLVNNKTGKKYRFVLEEEA